MCLNTVNGAELCNYFPIKPRDYSLRSLVIIKVTVGVRGLLYSVHIITHAYLIAIDNLEDEDGGNGGKLAPEKKVHSCSPTSDQCRGTSEMHFFDVEWVYESAIATWQFNRMKREGHYCVDYSFEWDP